MRARKKVRTLVHITTQRSCISVITDKNLHWHGQWNADKGKGKAPPVEDVDIPDFLANADIEESFKLELAQLPPDVLENVEMILNASRAEWEARMELQRAQAKMQKLQMEMAMMQQRLMEHERREDGMKALAGEDFMKMFADEEGLKKFASEEGMRMFAGEEGMKGLT